VRHDYPMLESGSCDNGKDYTYDKSVGAVAEQRSHDRSIRCMANLKHQSVK
jgi:hypothetical protein